MDNQKRGLDVDIAEAAMKRAAEKAVHGSREERSGRFDVLNDPRRPRGEPQLSSKVENTNERRS